MLNKTAKQGGQPGEQHQQQPQQGINSAGHSTTKPRSCQKSPSKRKRSLSPATVSSFKRVAAGDASCPTKFNGRTGFHHQKDVNQINYEIRARVLAGLFPHLVVMEDGLLRVVDGGEMPRSTGRGYSQRRNISPKGRCRDSLRNYRYAPDNATTASREPQDLSRQSLINGNQQQAVHQDLFDQDDRHHSQREEQYYPSPQHNQSQQQQLQQQPPANHDVARKQLFVSKLEQRNIDIPDLSDPGETMFLDFLASKSSSFLPPP